MYLKIGLFVPILATIGVLSSNTAIAQDLQQNLDSQQSGADQKLARRQRPTWRFEIANDFMFDSDNGFTNGFSFQKHSTSSSDIDDLQGVRAFGKGLARRILPQRDGLVYRKGLRIGQNMATPELIEVAQIILDDVP